MTDLPYLNVPAYSCSAGTSEQGRRIVQYQGNTFAIIGFYFAHSNGSLKKRTLVYILRPFTGEGSAGLLLAE